MQTEQLQLTFDLTAAPVAREVVVGKPTISPAEVSELILLDEMPADRMTPEQVERLDYLDNLYRACHFVRLAVSAAEHARGK